MNNQSPPRNTFRLEGKVHTISPLQVGQKQSTGKEWCKVDILLQLHSDKHNKSYYFPVVLWGGSAKSAVEKKCVGTGDYISVEGVIVSSEYTNRDGTTYYNNNLTGYGVEIITKANGDVFEDTVQEEVDDVPF